MPRAAKLFRNGRSQAVRLPKEFRFEGTEVYIRRDRKTGDVILSKRDNSWEEFFKLCDRVGVPKDFLSARDRGQHPPQECRLFDDWKE